MTTGESTDGKTSWQELFDLLGLSGKKEEDLVQAQIRRVIHAAEGGDRKYGDVQEQG